MSSSKTQTTAPSKSAQSFGQSTGPNYECFTCMWLDKNVSTTDDNRTTLKELRQVINHLQTFDDSEQCEQTIRKIKTEKVVLIVSGSLGRKFIEKVHDLPQFSAFYVFCQDLKANEEWANQYSKLNGVFIERNKLVAKISKDQNSRSRVEEGASISVISGGTQSLEARNAIFMWFQLFIEVLLRMHHKSNDRKELIEICKESYKGNAKEMEIIKEFDMSYKSDRAIWWYTRDGCFYRMLNKALRVQNYDMLFAFRFFITDIAKQLRSEYDTFIRNSDNRNVIRVYRGQMIGNDELELMKKSIGEFLSMNSFLSTSRSRSTALNFARLNPKTNYYQQIIFEIQINPRLETKAFADIKERSYFENEDEVLIMLGALFKIEQVNESKKDGLWVAQVSLASEDDYHLKETFSYLKSTIGDDTDLDSLGKILIEMGEYEQARKCYLRMREEIYLGLGAAELGLGCVCTRVKEADEGLEHLTEALTIRQRVLGTSHADVGQCYSVIGALQWYARDDYDEALLNLKKAVEIQECTLPSNSLDLAFTYHQVASAFDLKEDYKLAVDYYNKALKIRQAVLPSNHSLIASTYNNLGMLYESIGDYSKGLEYLIKTITIRRKILPPDHEDIKRTENNISGLKAKMKK